MRYVVLHHTGVADPHYDLMVEAAAGSPLATWRVAAWPVDGPTAAVRVADHRRVYLDYEGDVSGGRGRVDRVAGGTCEVRVGQDQTWAIKAAELVVRLRPTGGTRWVVEQA